MENIAKTKIKLELFSQLQLEKSCDSFRFYTMYIYTL